MSPRFPLMAFLATAALAACRGEEFSDPPIAPIRDMHDQARLDPQAYSSFFEDGRSMRMPIAGTLSQEQYRIRSDEELYTGVKQDRTGYVERMPPSAMRRFGDMRKMIDRGRERYGIYCVPCHDSAGSGNGTVTKVPGFAKLPSLLDKRILSMPDGQMYATISNGVRTMPAYGPQVPVADRWAIVAYVRAMQLAQSEGKK